MDKKIIEELKPYHKKALTLVKDRKKIHCWKNAVWVLGLSGNKAYTKDLIKIIEGGTGELGNESMAKSNAVMALGYLAQDGSFEALEYLALLVSRVDSDKKYFNWSEKDSSELERNVSYARRAIRAIDVSVAGCCRYGKAISLLQSSKNHPLLYDLVVSLEKF